MDGTERLGSRIGNIRLDKILGSGGMGTVYEGYDEKLERRVAVKSVHGYSDAESKRRFLREARILSRLRHPNICQIHDHLEDEAGDYLVLELIEGQGLDQALADGVAPEARMSGIAPEARMSIARQLVAALAAAHEKSIVHRDLKPANVMLTPRGEIKVLDFGIAKAVREPPPPAAAEAPEVGEPPDLAPWHRAPPAGAELDTLRTASGQVTGTIGYLSPEQARGEAATAASDMYSLGLILQEVFSGEPACELAPLPIQLMRAGKAETRPVRGVDPHLAALIERLKSLAPGARPSAIDVAERLRWIERKPRRRARRLAYAVAGAVLLVLSAVMTFQRVRIGEEAERANREAEAARQVSDFLVELFRVSDPWQTEASTVTARQILDRGARRIASELEGQPLTRARLLDTMGTVYRQLGLLDDARPLLEQAVELRRGGEAAEVAESLSHLADLASDAGEYDEAEALFLEAVELASAALGSEHPAVAESLAGLGLARQRKGDYEGAGEPMQRALAIREKSLGSDTREVADSLNDLGLLRRDQGDYERAEALQKRSLEIRERILPPEHPDLALAYANLGALYYDQGDYERAEPLFRRDLEISERALGPDHPGVAISVNNLAVIYRERGDYERAEPLYRRSLAIRQKVLGEAHPGVGVALHNLAYLQRQQGQYEEADRSYRQAFEIWEAALGPDHLYVGTSLHHRAELARLRGRFAEAEPFYRRALEIRRKILGEDHPQVVYHLACMGRLRLDQGDAAAAEELFRQATAGAERFLADDPDNRQGRLAQARAYLGLGRLHQAQGDGEEARVAWQRALDAIAPVTASSQAIDFLDAHAQALLHLGRVEEARPLVARLASKRWRNPDLEELLVKHGSTRPD